MIYEETKKPGTKLDWVPGFLIVIFFGL